MGCVVVYLGLFGIGGLILGRYWQGGIAVIAGAILTTWLVSATASPAPEPSEVRVL
jgi:hypothetical protein